MLAIEARQKNEEFWTQGLIPEAGCRFSHQLTSCARWREGLRPRGRHADLSTWMELAAITRPLWSSADAAWPPLQCITAQTIL